MKKQTVNFHFSVPLYLLLLVMFIMSAGVHIAHGRVIRVNAKASGGDGSSWGAAYRSLTLALAAASAGDELWVAKGIYIPQNIGRTATFQIKPDVAVYGGFAATETQRDQRNYSANITILSGDLTNDDTKNVNGLTISINGFNAYHVVTLINATESTILDGFSITGGDGEYNDSSNIEDHNGGGIYNHSGSPILSNLSIVGNRADNGGGLYTVEGNPIIKNTNFVSNNADRKGGGLCNYRGKIELSNVIFNSNSSNGVNYGEFKERGIGGGMYTNSEKKILLNKVTFTKNKSETYGGGLHIDYSAFTYPESIEIYFNLCNFNENISGIGGGMHVKKSGDDDFESVLLFFNNVIFYGNKAYSGAGLFSDVNFTMENSQFVNNIARWAGGGIFSEGQNHYGDYPKLTSTLKNIVFKNNSGQEGGGFYNRAYCIMENVLFKDNNSSPESDYQYGKGGGMMNNFNGRYKITGGTFSGNKAEEGGGLFDDAGEKDSIIINTIFNGNMAESNGGGIYIDGLSKLINVTLSGNKSTSGGGLYFKEGEYSYEYWNVIDVVSLTNCIVWGNSATNGPQIYNNSNDQALVTYSDVQGGYPGYHNFDRNPKFVLPVAATLAPTVSGNYHLAAGSPAIDAGTAPDIAVAFDRDGKPRITDGDRNGIATIDLGAYEYPGPPTKFLIAPILLLLQD